MSIGSLFSGIGGLELGLEQAGLGSIKWQVEVDPYCQLVLAEHWPDVARFSDVRHVGNGQGGRSVLQRVDLICGGFPCQDVSSAGKRKGMKRGKRSGLWREFARIVRELRPTYVLVENVASGRSKVLPVVLRDLAALGYDAEWDCIGARDVGAPHERDRLFVLAALPDAYRDDGTRADQSQRENLSDVGRSNRRSLHPALTADSKRAGLPIGSCLGAFARAELQAVERSARQRGGAWMVGTFVDRTIHGLPGGLDCDPYPIQPWERGIPRVVPSGERRSKTDSAVHQARLVALGNAVVPQVAKFIGQRLRQFAID